MSDKDLVFRGEVLAKAHHHPVDGGLIISAYDVENIHAVPHEMSAREFLVAYKRMCASFPETDCSKCPIYTPYKDCTDNPCDWDIDKILPAVEKWAREHPEEVNDDGNL